MPDPHYTDLRLARIYDLDSPWSTDTDFYISLAGPSQKTIIDLGCGTGTLALGLAAAGHQVTGIDPAAAMLRVAKEKPGQNQNLHWHQAKAQNFQLGQRFDLILMTGHAFQVLLGDDDVFAALQNMANHLKQNGQVAFESRNPNIDWNQQWRRTATWSLAEGDVVQTRSQVSVQGEYYSFSHQYQFADATLDSPSTLRFMSPAKIEAMLGRAGLHIDHLYGNWDGSAFDPASSLEMIFVASLAS